MNRNTRDFSLFFATNNTNMPEQETDMKVQVRNVRVVRGNILFLFLVIFLSGVALSAQDFGLLLDQTADFTAHGGEFADNRLDYSGILIPRFSALIGDSGEVVISGGLNYTIDPFAYVPELLRTDITWRFGMGELRFGRMPYRDPTGLVAEGLFDGVRFSYDTKAGTLSAGGWYTGLLYKERAAIEMTDDERKLRYAAVDYDDPENTYFAPRRALASLAWEHPAIGGFVNMQFALLGQFDMTTAELNTYYAAAKLAVPLTKFIFDIGGCFEIVDYMQEYTMAMAGEMGLTWMLPTASEQLFSLRGRFSSGVAEGTDFGAFLPLTSVPQGNLLKTKLSGLSVVSLDYIARLHRALSLSLDASCFVRSDLGTYNQYPVIGIENEEFFLGTEFYGRIIWSLSSELQMNLGAGAFLPSLGNVAPDADALWRAEVNIVFLLF